MKKKYYDKAINVLGSSGLERLMANELRQLIKFIQQSGKSRDLVAGCDQIMVALFRAQKVNEQVSSGVKCRDCGEILKSSISLSSQLFAMSFAFILQEGLISQNKLTLPSTEMIIQRLRSSGIITGKNFITDVKCIACGFEYSNLNGVNK